MSMNTLNINNIELKYNTEDWNKKQSMIKNHLETFLIVIAVASFLLVFVGMSILGTKLNMQTLFFILALVLGMLSMIAIEAVTEKSLDGQVITGYRMISWLNNENIKVTMESNELKAVGKEGKQRFEAILKSMNCKYNIKYAKNYNKDDIRLKVDATNKRIVKIMIE